MLSLVSERDGVVSRYFNRHLSLAITSRLSRFPVTTNAISLVSFSFCLFSDFLFALGQPLAGGLASSENVGDFLFSFHLLFGLKLLKLYARGLTQFGGEKMFTLSLKEKDLNFVVNTVTPGFEDKDKTFHCRRRIVQKGPGW